MVQHRPKCLLQVTNSSSQNPSHRMVSSFTNQTHHYQPPLTQKHMGTYSFNTHLNELLPCMEIQKSPLKHNHGTIVGSQTHHWKVQFQRREGLPCTFPPLLRVELGVLGLSWDFWAKSVSELQLEVEQIQLSNYLDLISNL